MFVMVVVVVVVVVFVMEGSPLMTPCSFWFGAGGMGMGSERECNDMALGAD